MPASLRRRHFNLLAGSAALVALPALADPTYPNRPVRVIVPSAPGGNLDTSTRALMRELSPILGQPIVIENRPGASLLVGTQYVAKSPPDGYTLLAMSNTFTVAPSVVAQPGYDPIRDFDPVSIINASPLVIVVRPQSPVQNLQQLVQLARDKPDQVTYGSAGSGSSSHLAPLLFFREAGAPRAVHIPYKGNAPAIVDVMGGHLMMVMDAVITTHEHIKAGRLKGLAVAARSRVPAIPDVPTFAEQGHPGIVLEAFSGICAPAGTPREIRAKLHQGLTQAMKPEMRERLRANGQDLRASASPEEFGEFIRGEVTRFARVVKEAGIRPE
jgi:tripartite-type tricarboxylate transporter receptor subunit TctC